MESVLLGFSGGIDSCTSAQRLKDEGYRVVALTIDTMGDDAMVAKARAKAEEIDVEWLMYDAREEFKRDIIDYFCNEYAAGHTPAPCTRCNPMIKWRTLLSEANRLGIKRIATGHYFNIAQHDNRYYVAKGIDENKDQSYYLWGLSQETLARAITPMGNAIKSNVKQAFRDKSESMGICFLKGLPYAEFLKNQGITMPEGDIITQQGVVCGTHNGIARYTIGQRRGVGIPEGMRVIAIDAKANRIVVGANELLYHHNLHIADCNIVCEEELLTASDITIKIRGIGRNPQLPVKVEATADGYIVKTQDPAWAPALGQPLVFYRNNLVIGGGIVVGFN
ncbi:MAG: tRNA 2-thiouridine(34) synthase MnmA [Alistipes sp.]|nr:tRNA 2-thiouridine(34) synthase MnmA [Alistipes sp.]